jgi:hypothetical protein
MLSPSCFAGSLKSTSSKSVFLVSRIMFSGVELSESIDHLSTKLGMFCLSWTRVRKRSTLAFSIARITFLLLHLRQQGKTPLPLVPKRSSSCSFVSNSVSGFHLPALNTIGFFAGFFGLAYTLTVGFSVPSESFFTCLDTTFFALS